MRGLALLSPRSLDSTALMFSARLSDDGVELHNPTRGPMTFNQDDIDLFSKASHDRNPLHLSDDYARRTVFGERVVFGGLAALACLGRLSPGRSEPMSTLNCEFVSPVLMGVDYQVEITRSDRHAHVLLRDGKRIVVRMSVTFQDSHHIEFVPTSDEPPTSEPTTRTFSQLPIGFSVAGRWSPDRSGFLKLLERYELSRGGAADPQSATLLWASYLVGMELPGKHALFSSLAVTFQSGETTCDSAFDYSATVTSANPHFQLVTASATVRCGTQLVASVEIAAFVREAVSNSALTEINALCPSSSALKGQVALVIGASRGLGAAITQGLALQGCSVVANYARSGREAVELRESLRDTPGSVLLEQGNAMDVTWCAGLRDRLISKYGRLDYLISSASPPLLPLWVESEAVSRVVSYVADSLKLVLSPLATCLEPLAKSGGTHVLVSSSAVTKPVAIWPHYVSAKCALEGLVAAASAEYPTVKFVVMRPSRLRTELTNTPLGRHGSLPVALAASHLIAALLADRNASRGGVMYLDSFEAHNRS
jgi:NAD(P)-dependent dehydrogenase (short-subunit alcohol dehydrogenase family)/acyl dehydratase